MANLRSALLAALTGCLLSGQAVSGAPPVITTDPFVLVDTLIGENSRVNVGEYECTGVGPNGYCGEPPSSEDFVDGMYLVDVLDSDTYIDTLAVSTNNSFTQPFTWLTTSWTADLVLAADWDAANLGDFSTLFGDATGVHLFRTASLSDRITDGGIVDSEEVDVSSDPSFPAAYVDGTPTFGFFSEPNTEFAAFSGTMLVDCSNTNCTADTAGNVPAPAMLGLLGLGIAGIGYQRRKQVKAA